jgi:hypothetical protein
VVEAAESPEPKPLGAHFVRTRPPVDIVQGETKVIEICKLIPREYDASGDA